MKHLNLEDYSQEFRNFYTFADEYRREHGGIFDFRKSNTVIADGCKCRGYYEDATKKMVVAIKNDLSTEVFVHEFCHFMQDVEKDPVYTNCEDDFWWALDSDSWEMKNWRSILQYIALERDCELRALNFSSKYNLFDNKEYAQNANAYFYFYQYVFLTNNWSSTNNLMNSKLVSKMPEEILPLKTFEKIDMNVMLEYSKYF